MSTPSQLKAELDADPEDLGYAEPLSTADDGAVAELLNAKAYRGPVPINALSAKCLALGVTGSVCALLEIPIGTDIAPDVPMTVGLKAGLYKVITLIQTDYRLETADADDPSFAAGCDALIALGFLDADGKADLLALGDDRRSRAEVLWGDGVAVSAFDVGTARNLT